MSKLIWPCQYLNSSSITAYDRDGITLYKSETYNMLYRINAGVGKNMHSEKNSSGSQGYRSNQI